MLTSRQDLEIVTIHRIIRSSPLRGPSVQMHLCIFLLFQTLPPFIALINFCKIGTRSNVGSLPNDALACSVWHEAFRAIVFVVAMFLRMVELLQMFAEHCFIKEWSFFYTQ